MSSARRRRPRHRHETVDAELGEGRHRLGGQAPPGRHADLQLAEPDRALDVGRGPAQPVDAGGGVLGREREPVPALAPRDGPPVGRRAVAADDDRDRALHGAGMGVDAGEVGEAAVELGSLVVPEAGHGVEELVRHGAALGEVGADGAELGLEVADADAEREAPTGEHVQRRQLLGQHDRVALREDHDPGRQPDPRRRRGGERERQERVERRVLRAPSATAGPAGPGARRARRPRATRTRPTRPGAPSPPAARGRR